MLAYFGDWAQFATMVNVLLLVALSWVVGLPLRRGGGVATAAWGFLVLAGAAALAYHGFRAIHAPVWPFAPTVVVLTVVLVAVVRALLPPCPAAKPPGSVVLAVAALAAILLPLRLVQVDPSSGLSTLVGWLPLYLQSSFAAGQFLGVEDMAAGRGVLSSYYYMTDLSGLATFLAQLTGTSAPYPAFLATSVVSALLALGVLAESLRQSRVALAAFVALVAAGLALDPFFRAVMARHYGDGFLILGGALVLHAVATGRDVRHVAVAAGAASVFLVFGRHYGAFYAALILLGGFLASRGWRNWAVWIGLGALLAVFSLQEAWWILHPPSPYYPGSKLVTLLNRDVGFWIKGALYDWGLYWAESPVELLVRGLWLVALVLGLPMIAHAEAGRRWRLLAPLALFVLPSLLVGLSGYRSGISFNKLTIVAMGLLPWYPAWLLSHSAVARRLDICFTPGAGGLALARGALALALVAGFMVVPWGRDIYQRKIVDRAVMTALRAEMGDAGIQAVADRPLLYLYYEPGSGLRNYIGGDLLGDLDFWGGTVWSRMDAAPDLTGLMAAIGWPNLYLSSPAHYGEFVDGRWRRFEADLARIESFPWVERVVRSGNARLVIVKRPQ